MSKKSEIISSSTTSKLSNNEDFDLFAPSGQDNLEEIIKESKYKWTNKFTFVLSIFLLVMASASMGAWYGYKQGQNNSQTNSFANLRSQFGNFGNGGNGGGNLSLGATQTIPGAGSSNGSANGIPNGSTSSNGRNKQNGNFGSAQTGNNSSGSANSSGSSKIDSSSSKAGGSGPSSTTQPNGGQPKQGGGQSGQNGQGSGARGGLSQNPELLDCLKKAGVNLNSNGRPDFQDPKTRTALSTCAAQLGIQFLGGRGGNNSGNNGATTQNNSNG